MNIQRQDEKKMPLGELVQWLDDNDVPYEVDGTERLTVKGDLMGNFRDWVRTRGYTSLPDELVCVEGNLWLERTLTTSLGNLTSVGRWLDLRDTSIISLDNLTSVGGWLDLRGAPITSLGNLISVGGWLFLQDTPLTCLGNLTSVGWFALCGTSVTSLDDPPLVGGDLYLDQSQLRLLSGEVLQKVEGKIRYRDQATEEWVTLSPDELEVIVAENERRSALPHVPS